MRIKEFTRQYRRDFTAVFECEHCGYTETMQGYDDAYFHDVVIPKLICPKCKKSAGENYRPYKTKYPEGLQV